MRVCMVCMCVSVNGIPTMMKIEEMRKQFVVQQCVLWHFLQDLPVSEQTFQQRRAQDSVSGSKVMIEVKASINRHNTLPLLLYCVLC